MGAIKPIKCGLIGCGSIALRAYMPTILKQFDMVDVVKCADTVPERAQLFAEKFGMQAVTNEDIYSDPDIEVVINLTFPSSHYEVTKAALMAGKHVHCEKMMAVTWEQGIELAKLAEEKGVWYTNAPDTFLGGAWQTARKLIDDGLIGRPIASLCVLTRGGGGMGMRNGKSTRRQLPPVDMGPNPFTTMERLPGFNPRGPGGSTLPFDMGGYYLHNLINLFGGIKSVAGYGTVESPVTTNYDPLNELYKEDIISNEPDTLSGSLEFGNGVLGSVIFASGVSNIIDQQFTVFGSEATLYLPDPNFFGGTIQLQQMGGQPMVFDQKWGPAPSPRCTVPMSHGYVDESRGVGLVDLAFAIRNGRKPRCHYSMDFQAFEVVHGLVDSCTTGTHHKMVSNCERPAAVRPGFRSGMAQQSFLDD